MFEHVRAALQAQITAAQAGMQQALAAQDSARLEVERQSKQLPPLQQALARAQASLQQASAARDAAQATVNQRQQERDRAQAARDQAAQALADHTEQEPDPTLPNGKPNPAHARWAKEQAQLQAALKDAQAALDRSNGALGQAQQARDATVNVVNAASAGVTNVQNQIAAATASLNAAQQRYTAAQAAVEAAQHVVTQLNAQVAALDARASRLVATPLNRADLEPAADAELTDLLARRHRCHDLLVQRAGVLADRASTLAAQDTTADAADALRRELAAWPDVGRYPSLASALSSIDSMVADSRAQRSRPPQDRTDDLQAASSRLHTALTSLQSALQQASAERDAAAKALTRASQDLVKYEEARS